MKKTLRLVVNHETCNGCKKAKKSKLKLFVIYFKCIINILQSADRFIKSVKTFSDLNSHRNEMIINALRMH